MARRILLSSLCLILLLALCSCSTFSAIVKSNMTGLPSWYYDTDIGVGKGNTGIVGEGTASSQRQAELLAYTDVISQLSSLVGFELGQEEYRELSVLGTLSDYNLTVTDTFLMIGQDGSYSFYVQAAINKELLERITSEENKKKAQIVNEIEGLVLQGDEYVKAGQETKAAENYLKAMALGYNLDYIDKEYSFDELLEVVTDLLESLSLSFVSVRPDLGTCTIALQRKGTFVSSAVSSAEVLATYTAVDTRDVSYQDHFVYVTDSEGHLAFNPINRSLVRSGAVTFSLNLGDELENLEALAGSEALSGLRKLLESKKLVFSYDKVYALGSIAVAVIEHDELGYVTGVNTVSDYITAKLSADGADAESFYPELDDEMDMLYEFNHSDRTEDCLLVIRMGLTGQIESRSGVYCASAEGLASFFDAETETLLYQSDVIRSNAFAENADQAVADAFKKLADIAYTLIKAVYV